MEPVQDVWDAVVDHLATAGDHQVAPGVVHDQVLWAVAGEQVDGRPVQDDGATCGDVFYQGAFRRPSSAAAPVRLHLGEVLSYHGDRRAIESRQPGLLQAFQRAYSYVQLVRSPHVVLVAEGGVGSACADRT